MKIRGTRLLAAMLTILGVAGCYGSTELADLSDPGTDAAADADTDPGADVPSDVGSDEAGDGTSEVDSTPGTPPTVWFASFRCPTLAGPMYPGVRIPAAKCAVAIRVGQQPAVGSLEVYVGTGKVTTIEDPAETEEIQVNWSAFSDREITLRARAIGVDGAEDDDIVPVRTLPATDDSAARCQARLDLAVARPDTWETLCTRGRLHASLAWAQDGFGVAPTDWRIEASLGDRVVADVQDANVDAAFDVPAGVTGLQSLKIVGSARLSPGACCAGPEDCTIEVARYLVVEVLEAGCTDTVCDVAVDGPSDRVVDGDTWSGTVRLDPPVDGATIEVTTDVSDVGKAFGAGGGTFEATGLRDGVHEVRAVAHLPGGITCSDRARFMTDVLPPEIEVPAILNTEQNCTVPLVISTKDATVVTLDPNGLGERTCDAPELRASGVVEWNCRVPMPANRQQVQVRVSGRDAAGHAGAGEGQVSSNATLLSSAELHLEHFHPGQTVMTPGDDESPVVVFGTVQVGLRLNGAGLTPEILETMGFHATVDGQPGEAAGLSLRPADIGADLDGCNALLFGTWDTTRVPDGLHQVGVRIGGPPPQPIVATVLADVRSGSRSGREAGLLQCDPAFGTCAPFRTGHVAGNVGIRADLTWWTAEASPTIRILASGEEVATCSGLTCDWVLDWDAQQRTTVEVAVEATGTGTEALVRLGASQRVVRDLHDLDDDGFRSASDGGPDCDDEDPLTFPGAPDPLGPDCATPGVPVVVPLSEAPDDARILDAARDGAGTLHVVLCDPGDQAFRYLRVPAEGASDAGAIPGTGVVDCTNAFARFIRLADGTLRLGLAPGDGTAGFAETDLFPPVADAIPAFQGVPAATIPDGILAIQGCSLVAYRRANETWAATTLRTECPFENLEGDGDAAASVDPDGTVRLVVRLWLGQTLTATLPASGLPVFAPLPLDPLRRVAGFPNPAGYGNPQSGWGWARSPGLGIGRDATGRLAILQARNMDMQVLMSQDSPGPILWTDGPGRWRATSLGWGVRGDDDAPRYVLRNHEKTSLGITAGGTPVAATTTVSLADHFQTMFLRFDWPMMLQTVVRRGSDPVALPPPAGLEPDDPVVVGGGTGAAEVVVRDVREGRVVRVSWGCVEPAARDSDCNGVDGPGGPACSGTCLPNLDAANRIAGSMPRCSGGVSDGTLQAGESCDGGAGGFAYGCRDCDYQDMPVEIRILGAAGNYERLWPLVTPSGKAMVALSGAPGQDVRVLALDPSAPGLATTTLMEAPSDRPFQGRSLLVQRSGDIVMLSASQAAGMDGQGPLLATRLDPASLNVLGTTTLDIRVFPRLALALADGRVLVAGANLDGRAQSNGRLVAVDPANPVTQTVFQWETVPEGRWVVPYSLVDGPAGDVVLLRTHLNFNVDETPPSSRLVVTALVPSTWETRKEWALELPATVVSASLSPIGSTGYLVAWSEETEMATEADPTVPRLVKVQRLDADLQAVGAPIEIDSFRTYYPEGMTVATSPLPASSGPGAVVVWGRTGQVGSTRQVTMRASMIDGTGALSAPVSVFDSPLYAGTLPDVAVAGPDALVVMASTPEIVERARFLDPRRFWGPAPSPAAAR